MVTSRVVVPQGCVCVCVCGHSRGVGCISSPGRIGVNEHFNLLARCQGLLSVITSPSPGDKHGVQWRGAVHGAHLMHDLALRKPDQSLRFDLLLFVSEHQNSLI